MKVELAERGGRPTILVEASYVEKEAVRAIPGSRWERDEWTVPASWAACLALRGTFGDRLEVGPELSAWSWKERERVDRAVRLRTAVDHDVEYDPRLRPFQRAGVAWLLETSDGGLLGDDLGSGKTVQLCVALRERGVRRGIVVAPKSTLPAWRDHLRDWAGLRPAMATGSVAKRRKAIAQVEAGEADVVVISWENLRQHSSIAPFGSVARAPGEADPKELNMLGAEFVVLDEAQRIKDPTTKMARAAWALGDGPAVRVRYAATATPVANALDDLWAIMRFVSPDEWPAKSKFVERYCDKTWNRWGGLELGGLKPATSAELFGFFDPRYRAMPKDVVLRDLPPRLGGLGDPNGPMIREAEMGSKQAKAYRQMVEQSVADLDSGRLIAAGGLARAARLLMLASAYGDVVETTVDGRLHQRLELSEPSCKLDVLEDMLTGELSSEEAVVVFTVSRQLAVLAAARAAKVTGRPCSVLVGGQTDYEREKVITDFQAGQTAVMAVTVAAGGAGVTLTRARASVYLQRDFSYLNNFQSEGRTHRIGSEVHDRVMYYDVVTPGTPDLRVLEVLAGKQDVASTITRFDALRAFFVGE